MTPILPFYHGAEKRAQLIDAAQRWLGTPFKPHSRALGSGVDCVNLAAALYLETGLVHRFDPPKYTMDGGDHMDCSLLELYLDNTGRFVCLDRMETPMVGDLLILKVGRVTHHSGVMLGWPQFIQVYQGQVAQLDDMRDFTWFKRLTKIYRPY